MKKESKKIKLDLHSKYFKLLKYFLDGYAFDIYLIIFSIYSMTNLKNVYVIEMKFFRLYTKNGNNAFFLF